MKKAILFLFAIMLCIEEADAQTFQSVMPVVRGQTFQFTESSKRSYSTATFSTFHQRSKMCLTAKISIAGMGVGVATSFLGLVFLFANDGSGSTSVNDNQGNLGLPMIIGGLILTGASGLVGIGAGIHDHSRMRRARWGIVTPKRNELGLAYNF